MTDRLRPGRSPPGWGASPDAPVRENGKHGITVDCIPPRRIMSGQIRRNYPHTHRKRPQPPPPLRRNRRGDAPCG